MWWHTSICTCYWAFIPTSVRRLTAKLGKSWSLEIVHLIYLKCKKYLGNSITDVGLSSFGTIVQLSTQMARLSQWTCKKTWSMYTIYIYIYIYIYPHLHWYGANAVKISILLILLKLVGMTYFIMIKARHIFLPMGRRTVNTWLILTSNVCDLQWIWVIKMPKSILMYGINEHGNTWS